MTALTYADKIYKGGAEASAVYLGATKVWPLFKPSDLSGLKVWLDASKLALANGAAVSSWPNLAGAPNPAILGTPAPTFRTNALNTNMPVVRVTQGQGRFRFTGSGVDKDYTLIYVGRRWQLRPGRIVTALGSASNLLVGFHGTEMDTCYIEGWLTPTDRPTSTTQWRMHSADSTSSAVARFFVNGVLSGSGAATPAKGWGGTLNISGYTDDADVATSQQCDCEIAELVMYNRKLSDVERQLVEKYLREKWAAPTLFKPTDLVANLVAWFDGADPATIQLAGSGTSGWVNKGVGAMTLTQTTDAYRPIYNGSDRSVSFAAGQVFMVAGSPTAFDVVWVGRPLPASVANWRTLFRNNTSGLHQIILESGSTKFGGYNGGFFQGFALTWDQVRGIGYGRYSASVALTVSRDGGAMAGTGTTLGAANISLDTVGAYSGPPPSQPWGDINEMIIIPYNLDGARQMLEGYLAHKWGLTGLLPAGHPHKTTPP